VTHMGIVVYKQGELYLRHASSKRGVRRVVDEPLAAYLGRVRGVVVLRRAR